MTATPRHSFTYAGAVHNVYHCAAHEGLPRHEHSYPHATICHAGRCAIRKEGVYKEITKADGPINLVAGQWHEIEALEDGTVFENIHIAGAM